MTGLRQRALLLTAWVTGLWFVAGGSPSARAAGGIELASHARMLSRIERLEHEIAQLGNTAVRPVSGRMEIGDNARSHCDVCPPDCCDGYCQVENGWYAGAEAVIAKPYFEDGIARPGNSPAFDMQTGPRFWLGCRNRAGFGIRGRYWWWSGESESPPGGGPATTELDFQVADLEGTRSVCWGPMTADFVIGARWARVKYAESIGGAATTAEGVGPSIAADTRIPLGITGFRAVGNVRGTALFGGGGDGGSLSDQTMYAGEVQLGLEYARPMSVGVVSLYVLSEAQVWMAATAPPDQIGNSSPDDDVALLGITLGGQFRY
jgi:hypothetical protein